MLHLILKNHTPLDFACIVAFLTIFLAGKGMSVRKVLVCSSSNNLFLVHELCFLGLIEIYCDFLSFACGIFTRF